MKLSAPLTSAVAFASPHTTVGWTALALAGLMLAAWAIGRRLGDVSIVDLIWGPAFVLVAVVAAAVGSGCAGRRWLLAGLTGVWGLRLAVHLTRRKLAQPGEDRRYTSMRERHPDNFALWSLGAIFLTQGALVWLVSLPIQVAVDRPPRLSAWIAPGIALFAIGLLFEALGDDQLRRFKADPANEGRVMDRGLWRYTRHPNYFGDACVWWGIWLLTVQAGGIWWTAIGPVIMTLLLVRVSGKELLERDLIQRRPGYADYVRRTSGFIPLPPRRRPADPPS
jgi:steroid 5-alpha reductase family enzyme